jgi:cytochrome P450
MIDSESGLSTTKATVLFFDYFLGFTNGRFFTLILEDYFAVFCSILVAAITIALLSGRNNAVSKKRKPPLLPRAQAGILETVRELAGDRMPFWMLEQARQIGSYSYRLSIPGMAIIGDTALARSILLDPRNEKALDLLKSFEITLGGTCMFTQPNNLARTTRKNISRAFSPELVKNRMTSICASRYSEWAENVLIPAIESCSTIDPCREMLDLAFKVVCEVVFDYNATREECELFMMHGEVTAVEFGFKQMMNPLRPILGSWLAERAKAFESVRWIQSFGLKMLAEHQQKKEQGSTPITVISLIDDDPRFSSNQEKLPELMLWLFAGHDTVGYTMGTALYHLAQHPSVMAKARSAILWNDKNNHEIGNLQEVRNIIRESNRLLPATASISIRKLGKETKTLDGKFTIPEGTTVFLPQYLPNHDHRLYGEPNAFRPDRWETATKEMMDAIMPFSVGPRSCPGLALAKVEMNHILPKLIRDFDFEVVREGEPKFFITLKPVGVLLRPKYAQERKQP